jgi:MoxR-like ATPase
MNGPQASMTPDTALYDEVMRNPVGFILRYQELMARMDGGVASPAMESVGDPPAKAEAIEVSRSTTTVKVSRERRSSEIEFIGKVDAPKDYFPTPETVEFFALCEEYRQHKGRVVGLVKGDHGTGKTISVHEYAARKGLPLLRIDCSAIRDTEKWFGERALEGGETVFHPSSLMRALEKGNCVVLLDEITRAQDSSLLNPLMPLLDFSGRTHVQALGRDVRLGSGIAVFMTMNEGRGYTGVRDKADIALVDRTQFVLHTRYPTLDEETEIVVRAVGLDEKHARSLVQVANSVRAEQFGAHGASGRYWSIRMTLVAAEALVLGGGAALRYAVSNYYAPDGEGASAVTREKVVSALAAQFGNLATIPPLRRTVVEEKAEARPRRRRVAAVQEQPVAEGIAP